MNEGDRSGRVPLASGPDRMPVGAADLADFTMRAERAASIVHHGLGSRELVELVVRLAANDPVAASPTLVRRFPSLAAALRSTTELIIPETAAGAARAAVGVSVGEALVVETGSVLVSEWDLADRLVSMLSPTLVQIVPSGAILRTLDEVGVYLAEHVAGGIPGYHALVTGPSRSADIERSLTIGVQGPAELHVVVHDADL